MTFITKTISKDLKSIPFNRCLDAYVTAADTAEQVLEQRNRENYDAYIAQLEEQWNATHEAPYEGNFSDAHPYIQHPDVPKARRKAGNAAIVQEFIPLYKLDTIMQTWVMPQIISWIARSKINWSEVLDESGKISAVKVLPKIFDPHNDWDMGLYRFLMLDQRSSYLKTQYKGEAKPFCSLVPLILYAFKLHDGVAYSRWSRETLHYVVNESLCEAMLCTVPEGITREDILAAREQGLIYKTGAKAGTSRDPVTTYKLYDTHGSPIHDLPDLAKTMLAQIWCAHPKNRTRYMVLDPRNWDLLPPPLVSDDIFAHTAGDVWVPSTAKNVAKKSTPWD